MKEFFFGAAAPVVVAAGGLLLARKAFGRNAAVVLSSLDFLFAFLLAYTLLGIEPLRIEFGNEPTRISAQLQPRFHWHWLPYVATVAAVVGSIATATKKWPLVGWILLVVLALAAAWLLTPDWKSIQASRHWYVAALAGMVFLICVFVQPLAERCAAALPAVLVAVAVVGAAVLLQSGNLTFAILAGAVSSAMFGCAVSSRFYRSEPLIQSATAAFVVLVCGLMFSGYLNSFSDVPLASYVLVPLAPLMLWASYITPLNQVHGKWQVVAQWILVMSVLLLALGLALAADPPWADSWE